MTSLRHFSIASTLLIAVVAGCATPISQATLAPTTAAMSQPLQRLSPNLPPADGGRPATMFSYIAMDDHLSSPRSFLSPTLKEVTANDPGVVSATVNWAFSTYQSPFKAMTIRQTGRRMYAVVWIRV